MDNERIAVILVALGSPSEPTAAAVRPYLREFLSDPRIIEVNPLIWKPLLNCVILPRRSGQSADRYKKIWMKEGSPLLVHTKRLAQGVQGAVNPEKKRLLITWATRYGEPNLKTVLKELHEVQKFEKILVIPLYPQYSSTTVGSVMDRLCETLMSMRSQPKVRAVRDYYQNPLWAEAISKSIQQVFKEKGPIQGPARLVYSFHGMPKSYVAAGDPYEEQSGKSVALINQRLGIDPALTQLTFQSKFGKFAWLEPGTVEMLQKLAHDGIERVDVVCPCFSCDCLETTLEIGQEAKEIFLKSGGKEFNFIGCLNESEDAIKLIADIVKKEIQGWE